LFSNEKMAEFKEFEKKKDTPALKRNIDISGNTNEEETDSEILMLEKLLAEKKARKKNLDEEMV